MGRPHQQAIHQTLNWMISCLGCVVIVVRKAESPLVTQLLLSGRLALSFSLCVVCVCVCVCSRPCFKWARRQPPPLPLEFNRLIGPLDARPPAHGLATDAIQLERQHKFLEPALVWSASSSSSSSKRPQQQQYRAPLFAQPSPARTPIAHSWWWSRWFWAHFLLGAAFK